MIRQEQEARLIISLSQVYEMKARKEQELKYYKDQLEKLNAKMAMISGEIDLTNIIIKMIEDDAVVDLRNLIKDMKK